MEGPSGRPGYQHVLNLARALGGLEQAARTDDPLPPTKRLALAQVGQAQPFNYTIPKGQPVLS